MAHWLALLLAGIVSLLLCVVAVLTTLAGLAMALLRRRRPSVVVRRSVRAMVLTALVGVALVAVALRWGHSPAVLAGIDVVALTIPRDASQARSPDPRWEILAGDMHCHVFPWDPRHHAARDLDATVRLARSEGLDFVVVTPHFWWVHWPEPWVAEHYRALHRDLHATLAARSSPELVLIPGIEYTDDTGGHTGLAFGDVDASLAAFERQRDPSDFFRTYVATGGLVTIHHPFLTPLRTRLPQAGDISWRPFTAPDQAVAPAITTLDGLATQVETFNLGVSELRDRFSLDDHDASLRRAFAQIDREVPRRRRRMTATGGTDSHGSYLRPTVFVLAERRDRRAIREALMAGRTCVRSRAGCTFEASADSRSWGPPGSALEGVTEVYVRARGERIEVLRDGVAVAHPRDGEAARVAVTPGRCTVLRATVDAGWSGAVYANCGL